MYFIRSETISSYIIMDHNNPSPSKSPIQLSLYDITILKGKLLGQKIELDKLLHLNHAGLRVHGIEFHFGYENLISICEIPDKFGKIRCTNEMDPEFYFDDDVGKLRIKERFYLKFGRIVSNIKTYESYYIKTLNLIDAQEQPISTELDHEQIINLILNNNLRLGQQKFPLVEKMSAQDEKIWYKAHLGNGESEEFALPEGMRSAEEWNRRVAKIKEMEEGEGCQKLQVWNKIGPNRKAEDMKFGPDLINLYEKLNKLSSVTKPDKCDSLTTKGPFVHGSYDKVRNNCADFAKQFVNEVGQSQQCKWPREMKQLRLLVPVRFANKIYRRSATEFAHQGQIVVDGSQILVENLMETLNGYKGIESRIYAVGVAVVEIPRTMFIEMPQFLLEIAKINLLTNL